MSAIGKKRSNNGVYPIYVCFHLKQNLIVRMIKTLRERFEILFSNLRISSHIEEKVIAWQNLIQPRALRHNTHDRHVSGKIWCSRNYRKHRLKSMTRQYVTLFCTFRKSCITVQFPKDLLPKSSTHALT